jgi:DNA-binding NtrC family response regulator
MNDRRLPILIVEDDPILALNYIKISQNHAPVIHATNIQESIDQLARTDLSEIPFSLAIIDLHLGIHSQEGLKIVALCTELGIPSFVLSSSNDSQAIEESYLRGCLHFLNKLEVKEELNRYLTQFFHSTEKSQEDLFDKHFITKNTKLRAQISGLIKQNLTDQCIFISGETGTGKSHLANLIHENQATSGDFVTLHSGEISEQLMESELFGHEKGAFTGADKQYLGRIRKANKGTLFLDEVGTLSTAVQIKLLKTLDEKIVFPVGGNQGHKIQFTLISATWEDLREKMESGKFREDLWYRLMGQQIHIPPLRERPEDVHWLINHFMEKSPRKFFLAPGAKEKLMNYLWPGNVRELQKIIKRLSFLSKGIVKADDIILMENQKILEENQNNLNKQTKLPAMDLDVVKKIGLTQYLELIENQYVKYYLEDQKASVTQTMKDFKISSARFYRIQKTLSAERH